MQSGVGKDSVIWHNLFLLSRFKTDTIFYTVNTTYTVRTFKWALKNTAVLCHNGT